MPTSQRLPSSAREVGGIEPVDEHPSGIPQQHPPSTTRAAVVWPGWLRVVFRWSVGFFAVASLYLVIGYLPLITAFARRISMHHFRGLTWAVGELFEPGLRQGRLLGTTAYLTTALVISGLIALIWSLLDRHRPNYERAHEWFRIYLRYALAAVMLSYGFSKIFLVQFPSYPLPALIRPLGDFTRNDLFWMAMGASREYQFFTGLVEALGGLLLLWRRTTTLGALILFAGLTNVVMINFTYQIGVLLPSTVYLLMAVAILAPEARRLIDVVVFNRPVVPSTHAMPPQPGRSHWRALALKAVVVAWLVGSSAYAEYRAYFKFSDGAPRPATYGIYKVDEFSLAGEPSVAAVSGERAWLQFVVGQYGVGAIQTRDGSVRRFEIVEDSSRRRLRFTGWDDESDSLTVHYRREADGRLFVAGRMKRDSIEAWLRPRDLTEIPLRRPLMLR